MNPEQDQKNQEQDADEANQDAAKMQDLDSEKDPVGGRIKGAPQTIVNNDAGSGPLTGR